MALVFRGILVDLSHFEEIVDKCDSLPFSKIIHRNVVYPIILKKFCSLLE